MMGKILLFLLGNDDDVKNSFDTSKKMMLKTHYTFDTSKKRLDSIPLFSSELRFTKQSKQNNNTGTVLVKRTMHDSEHTEASPWDK